MVKLWTGLEQIKEQEILENLIENDIICYVEASEAGEYLKIAKGFALSGADIYVEEKDARKASELLGKMKARWNLEQMQEEWIFQEEESETDSWNEWKMRMAKAIVAFIVAVVLYVLLL
ncbi:MAG: hypothetical protein UHS41_03875 [Lachnospiraceae bacterium]|nr:hypothetical protein [Lachnospiraceae bacterium]